MAAAAEKGTRAWWRRRTRAALRGATCLRRRGLAESNEHRPHTRGVSRIIDRTVLRLMNHRSEGPVIDVFINVLIY